MTDANADLDSETDEDVVEEAGGWAYAVAGLVPIAFGTVILIGSVNLRIGSPTEPGPGLWPFGLSVVLIVLSLGLLVGRRRFGLCEALGPGTFLVLIGAAMIGGFVLALPLIGFEIPSIVLLFVWLKVLGRESWRVTIIVALAAVATLHLLFVELLGVSIPHLIAI